MGNKLYVGNLPYTVSEEQLQAHFAQCGSVSSVKIITDRETNRSKGFGFVEMGSDGEAQAAIEQLNGQPLMERSLTVSEARPQAEGGRGGGGGFRGSRGGGGGNGGGGGFRRGPRY